MKLVNDYCDHCNSQRDCVKIDNYDAEPIFNICLPCINYARNLLEKDKSRVCFWDTHVGIVSEEDRQRMRINFAVDMAKGLK